MFRTTALGVATALFLNVPSASAGIFTDDMSKCLVKASSAADQALLMRWIFSVLSLNPEVASLSAIPPEQRNEMSRQAGELFQRLMLVDCRSETVAAVKNEGVGAIQASFGVLGQVAVGGLMRNPRVALGLNDLDKGVDREKFLELFRDAGIIPPAR